MALPFLGTPDSYNIAQQEQSRQRSIEKTTALESIQNVIGSAVPALSGVVAGVFANSPLIGLGTAYVTDQLRQASKDRSQRRQAKRLENRQRKAAADLLVESGQFQNRRDALAAIEEQRTKQELENIEREKDSLVKRFGLQRREEEKQKEEEEGKGKPQPVRDAGGEGLALESTVASIDNNISGIGDLILDRFADQEQNEVEQRQLQKQQLIQQREMRLEAERATDQPRGGGVPEKVKDGGGNGFMKGALGAVLSNPIVGIVLAICAITGAIALFKDDIVKSLIELPGNIANSLFEKIFGTSGVKRENQRANVLESDVKFLQGQREEAQTDLTNVQQQIAQTESEMPTSAELEQARQTVLEFEKKPFLERIRIPEEVQEARKIAARASSPKLEKLRETEQQVQERIQRVDKQIEEKQTTIRELRGEVAPDATGEKVNIVTGKIIKEKSLEQSNKGGGSAVIADARTTSTQVNQVTNESKTYQGGPLQPQSATQKYSTRYA